DYYCQSYDNNLSAVLF
nr:immunoglobulin light chain junction region [Macaca mulatta]MOX80919.1 immunoglobulin light chain junction region [Macaca mulatta]MOX81233.1 immunoglobulin light chain junction region [Macaca mulatta]MOX81476.1 immunoglobulin light chain junction region [Macaca mulatta]MOX82126.1 immunoglobulin light chain junction region [Macaca mulatta]